MNDKRCSRVERGMLNKMFIVKGSRCKEKDKVLLVVHCSCGINEYGKNAIKLCFIEGTKKCIIMAVEDYVDK